MPIKQLVCALAFVAAAPLPVRADMGQAELYSKHQDFLLSSHAFEKLHDEAIESPKAKPEQAAALKSKLLAEYAHLATQRHLSRELSLRILQCADQLLSESSLRDPQLHWQSVAAWQALMIYDLNLAGVRTDVPARGEDRWDSPFQMSDDGTPEGIKQLAARSVAVKMGYAWPYSGGKAGQDKLGGCGSVSACRKSTEESVAQGNPEKAQQQMVRIYYAFPDDWLSAESLGMFFFTQKRYPEAVRYLDSAVARMLAGQADDGDIAGMRGNLLHAYDELGRANYFSDELCLRMLHQIKAILEYADKAGKGGVVIEMEDSADKALNNLGLAAKGTKAQQLVLPLDGIPRAEKEASAAFLRNWLGRGE